MEINGRLINLFRLVHMTVYTRTYIWPYTLSSKTNLSQLIILNNFKQAGSFFYHQFSYLPKFYRYVICENLQLQNI